MHKNFAISYILTFLFICLATLPFQIFPEDAALSENNAVTIDKTIASVNGKVITLSELKEAVIEKRARENLDIFSFPQSALTETLKEIIDTRLLLAAADKENIKIKTEDADFEVEKWISYLRLKYSDSEKFEQTLKKQNLTLDLLKESFRKSAEEKLKIQELIGKKLIIDDKEVEKLQDRLKKENKPLYRYVVSHILIKCAADATQEESLEKEKKAMEILSNYQKQQTGFSELAKTYSDDTATKDSGGDLGVLAEGEFAGEIESKVKTMKPGDVAGPVRTKTGFHIIYLRDTETPREQLIAMKFDAVKSDMIRKLRADADIKIFLEKK